MATRLLITGMPAFVLAAVVAGPAVASPAQPAEDAGAARAEARLAVRAALELQASPPASPPELPGMERNVPPRAPVPRIDERGRSKGHGEGARETGELETTHAEDDVRAAHLDTAERAANGEAMGALHRATANSRAAAAQARTNSARQGRGSRGRGQALEAAPGPGP